MIWAGRALLCNDLPSRRARGFQRRRSGMLDHDLVGLLGLDDGDGDESPDHFRRLIQTRLADAEASGPGRDAVVFHNAHRLAKPLGLRPIDEELLVLYAATESVPGVSEAFESVRPFTATRLAAGLGAALGRRKDAIRTALLPRAPLVSTGLLRVGGPSRHDELFRPMDGLAELLFTETPDVEELLSRLFIRSPAPTLGAADYSHIADQVALVTALMRSTAARRVPGVNVLFYGPPGTGKTELARLVAREAGLDIYEVRSSDVEGEGLNRGRRLAAYELAQRALHRNPKAVVLFDEVEDVFLPGRLVKMGELGKGAMNALLESHPVPTIWVCNHLGGMDPAQVRRFDLVVELRRPPVAVRQRILDRRLSEQTSVQWRRRWAQDDRLAPAHVDRAARLLEVLGSDAPSPSEVILEHALTPQLDLIGTGRPVKRLDCGPYDPALSNASVDLEAAVRGLSRNPRGAVCLYGPPGTGKTAFAFHLAEQLERPLLVKRASDLLGMYVGQTEARIAGMFRDAHAEGAVVLLDEADSFLRDRRTAQRSWEVSQVNELLVQMECFDGLFVCATNLLEALDQASLRRFSLKIRFDALDAEQRWRLFGAAARELGTAEPPSSIRVELDRLAGLTAGDFAAVVRLGHMLGTQTRPEKLVEQLAEELALRGSPPSRAVGFRTLATGPSPHAVG